MKHTYTLLISLIATLFSSTLFAQKIEGFVIDNQTNESIPGVTIRYNNEGVVTDIDGSFTILSSTKILAIISYPEYKTDTLELVPGITNYIKLVSITKETDLGPVVVAASRRKQKLEEVTVSMDVISDELIANKGITDLKQAVDQTPGAYVMDGQVSIRGGSGFSYGAGSRVLILWNETPLLTADAGDPKWNAIPIESAQQIEVIKGASSVLYGSGALNGIISMIEKEPSVDPNLSVKIQTGIYDNPMRESLKWWTKSPMQYQGDLSYGKQYKRFGLNLGAAGYSSSGFRQGETEDRVRINGTVFWRPKQVKNLKIMLGWNAQVQKAGNFIIWQSDTFAYTPSGGADTSNAASTLTYFRGIRVSVDPSVKYIDKFNNRHQLKTRGYFVDNYNFNNPSQAAYSQVLYADYQFQRTWNESAWVLTAGTSNTQNTVRSELYGNHKSYNAAVYAQGERNWKKLNIVAGVRAEYFEQDGVRGDSDTYLGKDSVKIPVKPIFRTGIHYQVAKYTHLRLSFGQGVRYASIAERYAQTNVGGLLIFPNPRLKSETGTAAEIGIKQGIKVGNWKGFIDASAFINEYQNMMEFTFGNYIPDSIPLNLFNPNAPGYVLKWLGFQAQNAERARITGFEVSVAGEGEIKQVKVQTLMGYTFMNPVAINPDSTYLLTWSNDSAGMLKYRFKHLAKADIQAEYKGFAFGVSMRMNSFMVNVDKIFEEGIFGNQILPGLKNYRNDPTNQKAEIAFDARVSYTYKEKYKASFIVNNLTNTEIMGRPGDIQAPRLFIVQLAYKM